MTNPAPDQITDIILNRRPVFSLEVDTLVRDLSNRLTAKALFETLARLDSESDTFPGALASILSTLPSPDPSYLISFDVAASPEQEDEAAISENQETGFEYYLKLVFCNEEAAHYQFPLFPKLDAVMSSALAGNAPGLSSTSAWNW